MLKSTKIQYDFYPLNVSTSKKYENFYLSSFPSSCSLDICKFTFGVKNVSFLHLILIGITKNTHFI